MPVFVRSKGPLLALLLGTGVIAYAAFPFSVDDAYISARYARHLSHGLGYSFNAGRTTDGVTGPLWLVPMIAAIKAGFDPIVAAKLCGVLCAFLATALCVLRARHRADGAFLAWGTVALCVSSLSWLVWSVAGLETSAAGLAFTCMALATTAKPAPRGTLLGVAIGCAAWLRPELAIAAGMCLVCTFLRSRAAFMRAFVIGSAGALLLLLFRQWMFDGFLPLSAYAKPPELRHGIGYALAGLRVPQVWLSLALVAFAFRKLRREDRVYALLVLSHVLACVLAGGDWMPAFRLFAPMVPVAALLLAASARALPRRWIGVLALSAIVVLSTFTLVRELPAVRFAGANRARVVPELSALLETKPGAIMALDIGALGYLTDRPVLDLGGLVEPEVAFARGGHLDKKIDERWVVRHAPTWIVLHSARKPQVGEDGRLQRLSGYPVEQRIARMTFVREHYRVAEVKRYGDGYFYVILELVDLAARP